jgi:CheY-like chemotaxis protein
VTVDRNRGCPALGRTHRVQLSAPQPIGKVCRRTQPTPRRPQTETRVVIADDSTDYLDLVAILLNGLPGLTVVERASDGVQAVQLALDSHADLALLDVELPRLDSFIAATKIRQKLPDADVFLWTGRLTERIWRRADELQFRVFEKLTLVHDIELLMRLGAIPRNIRLSPADRRRRLRPAA